VSGRGAAILAVDGGNSKIDLALVSRSGALLALVNGPTISHQQVPMDVAMARLADLNARAAREAGVARSPRIAETTPPGRERSQKNRSRESANTTPTIWIRRLMMNLAKEGS